MSLLRPLAASLALAAAGTAAMAQTLQTRASITVVEPAQIARDGQDAVLSIILPKTGAATASGALSSYTLSGMTGDSYSISAPSSLRLTRADGLEHIELQLTPSSLGGTITGGGIVGAARFGIQGSTPVTSASPSGLYSGAFAVTVAFQ